MEESHVLVDNSRVFVLVLLFLLEELVVIDEVFHFLKKPCDE